MMMQFKKQSKVLLYDGRTLLRVRGEDPSLERILHIILTICIYICVHYITHTLYNQ